MYIYMLMNYASVEKVLRWGFIKIKREVASKSFFSKFVLFTKFQTTGDLTYSGALCYNLHVSIQNSNARRASRFLIHMLLTCLLKSGLLKKVRSSSYTVKLGKFLAVTMQG
jgi:hypothetical protein